MSEVEILVTRVNMNQGMYDDARIRHVCNQSDYTEQSVC